MVVGGMVGVGYTWVEVEQIQNRGGGEGIKGKIEERGETRDRGSCRGEE